MRLSQSTLAVWLSSTSLLTAPRTASAFRSRFAQRTTNLTRRFMSSSTDQHKLLRVGLCQFPVTADTAQNHQTAADYVQLAVEKGAQLVVLPEIWCSPYATAAFPEYAEDLPEIGQQPSSPSSRILWELALKHKIWLVGGSVPEKDGDKIYNTCLVFDPQGTIVAKHRKVHLFDIDVPGGITFFESETLSPGETISHFTTPWSEVGLGICYDIRFPEYAMILAQQYDCKVLIYPGAFNLTTGPAHWELLQRARALDNQCYVVTASPARSEDPGTGKYPHYTAWGHSTVVSPWGDVVATTDEQPGVVVADLDLARVDEVRASIPIGKQKRTDMYQLNKC